ncbi:hypothetical protein EFB08_21295 [Rufibacter latericius]|uniref:Uncharacterized protein n=1 Tax=Rufibacter latericius TaxID=2487040 RepID=A0A3M9MCS5_9BACT|nr:hypothetical protein EFB08_21295 [Rufibacter latericius]
MCLVLGTEKDLKQVQSKYSNSILIRTTARDRGGFQEKEKRFQAVPVKQGLKRFEENARILIEVNRWLNC